MRVCDEDLHQAIRAFQQANVEQVRFVDGHVDPGQERSALNRLAPVRYVIIDAA
jgi:hypothetical protein